jgi:hypothetical protein
MCLDYLLTYYLTKVPNYYYPFLKLYNLTGELDNALILLRSSLVKKVTEKTQEVQKLNLLNFANKGFFMESSLSQTMP